MKRTCVGAVALVLILASAQDGSSCSNVRGAWFHFHDRPGLSLERFLAGELGVIEPSFDAVYLYVAHRYLSERPLSEASRAHVASYWQESAAPRKPASVNGTWPGVSPVRQEQITRDGKTSYVHYLNCNPDAFVTASATRVDRLERYGAESLEYRRWLGAQNKVFENCARGVSIPEPSETDWGALEKADRDYQIAAAHFYARDFPEAATRFAAIAEDRNSPWQDVADYLVARAYLRQALVGDGPRLEYLSRAERRLEDVVNDRAREAMHSAASKHLDYIRTLQEPSRKLTELEASLSGELDETFPDTWRDYRWLSRRVFEGGPELSTWFWTLRGYPVNALDDAYRSWKVSGELSWLVLLLMKATPEVSWLDDVIDAAGDVRPESPAFWSVSYYRVRLLLDSDRVDAARQILTALPSDDALSLSDRNRFAGLRAQSASSVEEYLAHAAMVPVVVGSTDGVAIFSHPADGLESVRDGRSFFESDVTRRINRYFSPTLMAQGAEDENLPEHLRRSLALAAFARAFVTGDTATALGLASVVSGLAPELESSLAELQNANTDAEREFAGALAMLKFPGLGPSLRGAIDRVAPLDRFGSRRILNWWCEIDEPDVQEPAFFTREARDAGAASAGALSALEPAPIHLGQAVLRWADAHRDDRRVPEALHLVVRSTRYGCEWGRNGDKMDYGAVSKRAFTALHRRYPDSPWTDKTKYWYR